MVTLRLTLLRNGGRQIQKRSNPLGQIEQSHRRVLHRCGIGKLLQKNQERAIPPVDCSTRNLQSGPTTGSLEIIAKSETRRVRLLSLPVAA
jgi:hypothetical protein